MSSSRIFVIKLLQHDSYWIALKFGEQIGATRSKNGVWVEEGRGGYTKTLFVERKTIVSLYVLLKRELGTVWNNLVSSRYLGENSF